MTTLFLIYLIGCILSFFRARASFLGMSNKIKFELNRSAKITIWVQGAMSWIGFFSGIIIYFLEDEDKFF